MKHYKGSDFLSSLYASKFYEDTIMKGENYVRNDKTRWSNKSNYLNDAHEQTTAAGEDEDNYVC